MKTISYRTRGVCAGRVDVEIDGTRISSVRFLGGCSGNTQGVAALVVGMEADEAVSAMWRACRNYDRKYAICYRYFSPLFFMCIPGKFGRKLLLLIYRLANKVVRYN